MGLLRKIFGKRGSGAEVESRRECRILGRWDGEVPLEAGGRVCLVSSYDPDSVVDPHVFNLLEAIYKLDFAIIFVTTAPELGLPDLDRLRKLCAKVVHRENVGYDFGSWKTASELAGELGQYAQVLLANDSVYGPVRDLGEVFAAMRGKGYGMWGITRSLEAADHVQSYFLVLEQGLLRSHGFKKFWKDLAFVQDKKQVVMGYELGLSRAAREAGFQVGALCEYDRTEAAAEAYFRKRGGEHGLSVLQKIEAGQALNPTLFFWRVLVTELGCPFLKVQLVRDNPANDPDVNAWPEVLDSCGFDPSPAQAHLARTRRD